MAVHNAAVAGYDDIVRVILEADNMVDLNTPTFHTKETLAHLAVKHRHKNMFCILQSFGADLRIKDGNGRGVSEVTSDKNWARKIAACTAEYFANSPGDSKNSDTSFRQQNTPRIERLRKPTSTQQLQSARAGTTITTTSRGKPNKKKGKKGKGDTAKEESMIAAAALQGNIVVDTLRVLMRLLDAAGVEIDESLESETVTRLEDMLRKLAADIFARLRDPNIPASDKADDVQRACGLIEELKRIVASYSDPSMLNSARHHIRVVISSEASHGIHMMQRLYRVDHAAIAVSALAPVRELCDTTLSFTKFVVGTAQICVSVDRKPQGREISDVLEKRLLKTPFAKREPSEFRELVQMYSTARDAMGLGQTSSTATLRSLEWYLTSAVDDYRLQLTLDGMAGRPFYFECKPTAEATEEEFRLLWCGINVIIELKQVAVLGDRRVIYGGTSKADVAKVREMVFKVADRLDVQLDDESLQPCTTSVHVGDFVFSAAGIFRNGAAS